VKEGNPEDDNNVAFCCVQDRRGSCQPNAAAFFRREVTFSGVTANCTSNNGTGTCTYSLFYDPNVVSPQVTGQAVLDSSLNAQIPAELGPPIAKNFGCTTLEICTVNYGTISGLSNPFKQDRKNGFESGQLLGFEEFKGNDAFVGAANWKARFFRSEFNSELTTRLPLVIEGGGAAAPIEIDYRPNINDDTWSPQGNGIVPVDCFGTDEVNVTRIDFTTALINGADIIESFSFDSGSNTFRLMFRENAIPFEGTCSDGQRRFVEFKADLCIDPTVADPALCSEASRQEITGRDDVTVKTNSSGLCSELVNPSSS
jgi:hypothetical protein